MKTIIAGSRHIVNPYSLLEALDLCGWEPTLVLCGMARGVDTLGRIWAEEIEVPWVPYPAKWRTNGKLDMSAGRKRNILMAQNAEALIAIWDGVSSGTGHMIDTARKYNLRSYVHFI